MHLAVVGTGRAPPRRCKKKLKIAAFHDLPNNDTACLAKFKYKCICDSLYSLVNAAVGLNSDAFHAG